MIAPTFKQWLVRYKGRSPLIGDLSYDVKRDREWPKGRPTLRELHEYLSRCHAVEGAHKSLNLAWHAWKAHCRRIDKGRP